MKEFLIKIFNKLNPLLIIPFIFYYWTMAPDIGLGDTALLIDQMARLTLNSHVNNHNWTIFIGHLFTLLPIENLAFKGNLASLFQGSLAIILFYILLREMGLGRMAASLISGVLMVSYSFWWHSTIVESYAANAFFLLLTFFMLIRHQNMGKNRYLYAAFFSAALAVFNHVQMGSLLAACLVYLWLFLFLTQRNEDSSWKIKIFIQCTLFALLGIAPYMILLFRDLSNANFSLQVLRLATGGDFKSLMFQVNGNPVGDFLQWIFLQFPSPFLFLILTGIFIIIKDIKKEKKSLILHCALGTVFLINTLFFMFYKTWDQFAFYLPSFIILALWGGVGLQYLSVQIQSFTQRKYWQSALWLVVLLSVFYPPYLYSHIADYARQAPGGYWAKKYTNLYTENSHNVATYLANPDKSHWLDVKYFAERVFQKLPANALLIDDDSRTYYPLTHYYQRYYHKRADLQIVLINSWGFQNWGLSQEQLVRLIFSYQNDVFLMSDKTPYANFLPEVMKKGYKLEKFFLDEKKNIYLFRLQKTFISADTADAGLQMLALDTGLNFNTPDGAHRDSFAKNEPIMVRARFEKSSVPCLINFKWINPQGEMYYQSESFFLALGNTSVWSYLYKNPAKDDIFTKGKWSVIFVVNGKDDEKSSSFLLQ